MNKRNTVSEIEIAAARPFNAGIPHINGPSVYGASPNCDFSYYVPVCGERPYTVSVEGKLPPGLVLTPNGIIRGQAEKEGEWTVALRVENRLGSAAKKLCIKIQKDHLLLTPLMGWTSWNACCVSVTQEMVRNAAHKLKELGLADFGYSYINIDSCWQGHRDTFTSPLMPNKRFPEMGELVRQIHQLGLKVGIYSTPMVHAWGSCENLPALPGSTGYPLNPDAFHSYFGGCGKTHFEEADARQWAAWQFDYLKYDWPKCDPVYTEYMSKALRATGRDFVFSLTTGCKPEFMDTYRKCANMFRAGRDTLDSWQVLTSLIFPPAEWLKFSGPGHWYDMDMLALGDISAISAYPCNQLTRNEQITHFTVWAFMASPLQLSCNLDHMDDFTMSLVTNEDLLQINQDELGAGAVLEAEDGSAKVYTRLLANGDFAAAFINAEDEPCRLALNRPGARIQIYDVLAGKELGTMADEVAFTIPVHGTRVVRCRIKP